MREEKRVVPLCRSSKDCADVEGRYANYFEVGHNEFEFVIDFGQFYHDQKEARMHTRIITSSGYMRALLNTFRDSFNQYEEVFGIIPEE